MERQKNSFAEKDSSEKTTITLKVSVSTKKLLIKAAQKDARSVNWLVRKWIDEKLEQDLAGF